MDPNYPLSPEDNIPAHQVDNPLSVIQPGERVLCDIKRHPIGILTTYLVGAIALAISISAAILVPVYVTQLSSSQRLDVVLACILVMFLTVIFTYIAVYIYQGNRLVLTTDSVTQIEQLGLFERHARQLSLANLENVSANQDGFLPMMLGYGTINVEAAGEGSTYTFTFCPNPNEYARKIIAAHEEFLAHRRDEFLSGNQPLAAVTTYNQPGAGQPPQSMIPR